MNSKDTKVYLTGDVSLTITGGEFSTQYVLAGADKVSKGDFIRTGDVYLTISGGSFHKNVGSGIMYAAADESAGSAKLVGSVYTTITGGSFDEGTWLYGGNFANKKAKESSGQTAIEGDVVITVDNHETLSSDNPVKLSNIVAGSHGYGTVSGEAKLVFTGKGIIKDTGSDNTTTYLTISGELWGGSSADTYTNGSTQISYVGGSRTLSFTGFEGGLDCTKIRGFNRIEFVSYEESELSESPVSQLKSSVVLDHEDDQYGVYNLTEISNWTFEYDNSLSGNFANSFVGDELILTGLDANFSSPWTIMENSYSDAFAGFGGAEGDMTVKLVMSDTSEIALTWKDGCYSDANDHFKLALDVADSSTKMILSLA